MITSSVLNAITFKYLNGGYPNKWNTLHASRKQGGFMVIPYCQKFNKDDTVYLQFESDSNTTPVLKIYNPVLNESINGTLESSYTGSQNRYFFGFNVSLGSDYYDKIVTFSITQGIDTLTSEPIYIEDLSEYVSKGEIKRIKYTNLDRNNSNLSSYWVDWSVLDYMFFYVESVDIETADKEQNEVLEGSQSKTIIAAQNWSGINLQTGGIPDYLELKLKAASSLDYFEVNDVQYVKEGEVSVERFGNSTLVQLSLNLTEKNTIGLNVDDLGIILTDNNDMAIIAKRNTAVNGSGWQVENPEGYMLHSVFIKHAITSANDAVVNLGTTIGGDELIEDIQGSILKADYSTKWATFSRHYLKDPDNASNLYFSVSGSGVILDIIVNFDTVV